MSEVDKIREKLLRELDRIERDVRILQTNVECRDWLMAERVLRDIIDTEREIKYTEEILLLLKKQEEGSLK